MSQAVIGVYMVILMQEDLAVGTEFYKKLGLKLIFHIPGKWSELEAGGIKIGLCPSKIAAKGDHSEHVFQATKGSHSGLVFQVTDVVATYKTLQEQGIVFLNEPTVATHGIMVSCADPSGNMFDLYQPTHDKLKKAVHGAGLCPGGACGSNQDESCCKIDKTRTGCC